MKEYSTVDHIGGCQIKPTKRGVTLCLDEWAMLCRDNIHTTFPSLVSVLPQRQSHEPDGVTAFTRNSDNGHWTVVHRGLNCLI